MGAGSIGLATAATLSKMGFNVSVYSRNEEPNLAKPIKEQKGIRVIKEGGEEFVPVRNASNSMREIVPSAEIIVVCVPSFGHRDIADGMRTLVRKEQVIVLTPGHAGSIEFARNLGVLPAGPLVGETLNPCTGARMTEPGAVRVRPEPYLKMWTAAFPGKHTSELADRLRPLFPVVPSGNSLELGLLGPNMILHPVPTIMNLSCVENGHDFVLYDDGFTTPVLKCMDAIDMEKRRICRALGFRDISMDDIYREFNPLGPFYRTKRPRTDYRGLILDRFIDEDVHYGLVLLASVGRWIGSHAPIAEAFIDLASTIYGKNFKEGGRTVETLGLPEPNSLLIQKYLIEGHV